MLLTRITAIAFIEMQLTRTAAICHSIGLIIFYLIPLFFKLFFNELNLFNNFIKILILSFITRMERKWAVDIYVI